MIVTICEVCACSIHRQGTRSGRFCSVACKAAAQQQTKPVDEAWLRQKYLVEELSTYAIAVLVQRNHKQVWHWLKGYGIPTRRQPGFRSAHIQRQQYQGRSAAGPYGDRDWLYHAYMIEQRSVKDIASTYGVTLATIYYFLRKYDIPCRTPHETRQIKHWVVAGAQNGMYGKTGTLNPNWKGGHTAERQVFYSSSEWATAAKAIWKRDAGQCQRCQKRSFGTNHRQFHIHHIVSFAVVELRLDLINLVLLCRNCHSWIHSKANTAKMFIR